MSYLFNSPLNKEFDEWQLIPFFFLSFPPFDNTTCRPESHLFVCSMQGKSTYLGAAPIVECLEKYQPNVIITSRVADAALFLAPMV